MADGKEVVRRFIGRGEPADRAAFAEFRELVPTTGEEFVGIALVADVPKQAVGADRVWAEVVNVMRLALSDPRIGDRTPVPITVFPSMKATIPVGAPRPGVVVIVEVKVTAWPCLELPSDETTAAAVGLPRISSPKVAALFANIVSPT